MIVGAGKSEIGREDQQAGNAGQSWWAALDLNRHSGVRVRPSHLYIHSTLHNAWHTAEAP